MNKPWPERTLRASYRLARIPSETTRNAQTLFLFFPFTAYAPFDFPRGMFSEKIYFESFDDESVTPSSARVRNQKSIGAKRRKRKIGKRASYARRIVSVEHVSR